jgi:hypothetical protein
VSVTGQGAGGGTAHGVRQKAFARSSSPHGGCRPRRPRSLESASRCQRAAPLHVPHAETKNEHVSAVLISPQLRLIGFMDCSWYRAVRVIGQGSARGRARFSVYARKTRPYSHTPVTRAHRCMHTHTHTHTCTHAHARARTHTTIHVWGFGVECRG